MSVDVPNDFCYCPDETSDNIFYCKFLQVGDANVASKATRDKMQEDIENLPASTFAAEECQHRKGEIQTHGEIALSLRTNSQQEYEHRRKWLMENKNMLCESLKLQSQQSTEERNKVWMNVKIVALSLNDVLNSGHITKASLQNSENFIPSAKDCGEQDSGLAQVVESRMGGYQEVSIYTRVTSVSRKFFLPIIRYVSD